MPIKIAIAEDNNLLAQALIEKLSLFDDLDYKFKGENGQSLIEELESYHNIDVILMDIQMPEMDGITATEIIKKRYPQIKIIMITVFDDDENIFNAIKAGADGYLLKDSNTEEIHNGIINVMKEGAAMTPSIALRTLDFLRYPEKFTTDKVILDDVKLTKRETEILTQLSKGLNYNQIAENLFISPSTVRKHIENTYKKLQVHNKMEAVQEGMKRKLI